MDTREQDPPARWRIAVTGSGGLIGSALVESLRAEGNEVLRVVRSTPRPGEIGWDPAAGRIDAAAFDGLDAVVHLAGENVGHRWTAARRARVRDSRLRGTTLLARTLASLPSPPRVLVSASAIGYYGDRGDEVLDETRPPGSDGFLPGLGVQWEAATEPAARSGIRVATPRFGVVLSPAGGALQRMLLPFRLGVGGTLGAAGSG